MKQKEKSITFPALSNDAGEKSGGRSNGSYRYFTNRQCEYYPCHKEDRGIFNCLFCFCPMYYAICLGEPTYIQINGSLVKDCSECDYPHRQENYSELVEYLRLSLEV